MPPIDEAVLGARQGGPRLATYTDEGGKILRTRPMCAYPKVPTYKGAGDTDKAENFVCAESGFEKNK